MEATTVLPLALNNHSCPWTAKPQQPNTCEAGNAHSSGTYSYGYKVHVLSFSLCRLCYCFADFILVSVRRYFSNAFFQHVHPYTVFYRQISYTIPLHRGDLAYSANECDTLHGMYCQIPVWLRKHYSSPSAVSFRIIP